MMTFKSSITYVKCCMDPEYSRHIDRLIVINDKWKFRRTSIGEVIPEYDPANDSLVSEDGIIQSPPSFFQQLGKASCQLDQVGNSSSIDRVLRINLQDKGLEQEEIEELHSKFLERLFQLLPSVSKCLFLAHTRDRVGFSMSSASLVESKTKAIFEQYSHRVGPLYGINGGIIGGKMYFNNLPGPAKWDVENECYLLDKTRFNKVWNAYFHGIRRRLLVLKKDLRIADAYGDNSWAGSSLSIRINRELVEFKNYVSKRKDEPGTVSVQDANNFFEVFFQNLNDLTAKLELVENTVDPRKSSTLWSEIHSIVDILKGSI